MGSYMKTLVHGRVWTVLVILLERFLYFFVLFSAQLGRTIRIQQPLTQNPMVATRTVLQANWTFGKN